MLSALFSLGNPARVEVPEGALQAVEYGLGRSEDGSTLAVSMAVCGMKASVRILTPATGASLCLIRETGSLLGVREGSTLEPQNSQRTGERSLTLLKAGYLYSTAAPHTWQPACVHCPSRKRAFTLAVPEFSRSSIPDDTVCSLSERCALCSLLSLVCEGPTLPGPYRSDTARAQAHLVP